MDIAYFTKTLEGLPLDRAAKITAGLGFDCADLLVRDGHAVSPERPEEIVKAAKLFAAAGVRTPMATIDSTRPDDSTSRLLGSCGEAGIGLIRLASGAMIRRGAGGRSLTKRGVISTASSASPNGSG